MTAFRMKNGKTLRQYCLENGISYKGAYMRCDEEGLTPEEAVERVRTGVLYNRKHYVNGMTLKDFCRQNSVCYNSVLVLHRRFPDMSIQDCAIYLAERGKK